MKEGAVDSLTDWYFYDGRDLNSRHNELAITIKKILSTTGKLKQNEKALSKRKV